MRSGLVMSSTSYSSSSEVNIGSSEVRRFPGIGFSLCAVPAFSRIQGILNGGYELSFWNTPEWRKRTGTIPSTSAMVSMTEVQSRRVRRYADCVECTGIELELIGRVE